MTRAIRCVCLALGLLLLATGPLRAAPCTDALRIGISELGYSGFLDNGAVRGAAADVLHEAARRIGCPVEVSLYPRSRLFLQFTAGQLDVAGSAARSDERDRSGEFVPYAMTRFHLVLTRSAAGQPPPLSLEQFASHGNARINVVRGAFNGPEVTRQLDRLKEAGRLEDVADFDVAFKKIAAGRADATLAPDMVIARLRALYRLETTTLVQLVPESQPMPVGAYLSLRLPAARRDALRQALRAMAADGTVLRIYRAYVDADTARAIARSATHR